MEVKIWRKLLETHALTELLGQGGTKLVVDFMREEDNVDAGPDAMRECGYDEREPDALQDEKTARKLRKTIPRRKMALQAIQAVEHGHAVDKSAMEDLIAEHMKRGSRVARI